MNALQTASHALFSMVAMRRPIRGPVAMLRNATWAITLAIACQRFALSIDREVASVIRRGRDTNRALPDAPCDGDRQE